MAVLLLQIRNAIAAGYSNAVIMQQFGIPTRTFYRYLSKIYEQDREFYEKATENAISTEAAIFNDRLMKTLRSLDEIASDESVWTGFRLEARKAYGECALAIFKSKFEGVKAVREIAFGGVPPRRAALQNKETLVTEQEEEGD